MVSGNSLNISLLHSLQMEIIRVILLQIRKGEYFRDTFPYCSSKKKKKKKKKRKRKTYAVTPPPQKKKRKKKKEENIRCDPSLEPSH